MSTTIVDSSFTNEELVSITTSKKFHSLNDLLTELSKYNLDCIHVRSIKDLALLAVKEDLHVHSSLGYCCIEFRYGKENITVKTIHNSNYYEITND